MHKLLAETPRDLRMPLGEVKRLNRYKKLHLYTGGGSLLLQISDLVI